LIRLELDGDRVVHEERLLTDRNQRIRDVRQGPDGALYVLVDAPAPDGKLLRIAPAPVPDAVTAPTAPTALAVPAAGAP
jgi:aldose sugar dehydrogenase